MTYDLRRLRLHGIIERIPKTHRYRLTPFGRRIAIFFNRVWARLLRPQLSAIATAAPPGAPGLPALFRALDTAIEQACSRLRIAA